MGGTRASGPQRARSAANASPAVFISDQRSPRNDGGSTFVYNWPSFRRYNIAITGDSEKIASPLNDWGSVLPPPLRRGDRGGLRPVGKGNRRAQAKTPSQPPPS